MKFWNQYPFVRLLIPFAAGILLAIHLPKPALLGSLNLILLSGILLSLVILAHLTKKYSLRWLPGLFINLFLLCAGYTLTVVQREFYHRDQLSQIVDKETIISIRITEPPSERTKSVRGFGEVISVMDSLTGKPISGKLLLYFEKDSASKSLGYGDVIVAKTRLNPVQSSGNPHQFDYRKYLAQSGIYYQTWITSENWQKTENSRVNHLFDFSYRARDFMLNTLDTQGLTGDEFAVAAAILLGFDDHMEPELRNLYAGAGALHVLCVSGLHVGIIFMIVSLLLKGLTSKKGKLLRFFILLASIWMYAFITGLAPSVLRAGVMFSLFSWRELAREKSNSYNILAASAFLLLAYDPYLISKIGFQLSYSAVLGIISLNDPICKLLTFKNVVLDYFWKLSVVSIAAQAGTFPLAIYYFNQFPVYFLLANLIVIPVVWLIVYTGIVALVVSALSKWLSALIVKFLSIQITFLNFSVDWINSLPFSKIDGLVLFLPQMVLVYLLIISLIRFFISKDGKFGVILLSISLLLTFSFIYQRVGTLSQQKLIVYNVRGYSAMDIIIGQNLVSFSDSALLANSGAVDFNMKNARTYAGIKIKEQLTFNQHVEKTSFDMSLPVRIYAPGIIEAGSKTIAIVDNDFPGLKPVEPLEIDLLILQNNCSLTISQLQDMFHFEQLVFDSSNTTPKIRKWREYCEANEIPYFDVTSSGALVVNL